jgi:hypothetical protein
MPAGDGGHFWLWAVLIRGHPRLSGVKVFLPFNFPIARLLNYQSGLSDVVRSRRSRRLGGTPAPRFHPISPKVTQCHPTGVPGKPRFPTSPELAYWGEAGSLACWGGKRLSLSAPVRCRAMSAILLSCQRPLQARHREVVRHLRFRYVIVFCSPLAS